MIAFVCRLGALTGTASPRTRGAGLGRPDQIANYDLAAADSRSCPLPGIAGESGARLLRTLTWLRGGPCAYARSGHALDPPVFAVDHLLRELVAVLIRVQADPGEILPDPDHRLGVEIIDQHKDFPEPPFVEPLLGKDACRRDRKQVAPMSASRPSSTGVSQPGAEPEHW